MKFKKYGRLILLGEMHINLDGKMINCLVKLSPNIKGVRLEIRSESGLTVVVPQNYTKQKIEEILLQKSNWILRHMPDNKPVQLSLFNNDCKGGGRLFFMGRSLNLIPVWNSNSQGIVVREGDNLYVHLDGIHIDIATVLEKWYRKQAEEIFICKSDFFKKKMGLSYRKVFIRGQKTRWGSCSAAGNLTLNWKLLFAPEEVINYVIIHELAHLKYMNHSSKFWKLVGQYCPDWQKQRKWLTSHENELKQLALFIRSDSPR